MNTNELNQHSVAETIDVGIEAVVSQIAQYVNLPKETEALIETALHQTATYGVEAAVRFIAALKERVE